VNLCIRPHRHPAALVLTLAAVLAWLTSSTAAALAQPWPQHGPAPPVRYVDHVRTVVVGGTPEWKIALVALAAGLIAAAAAVKTDRARSQRLQELATAVESDTPARNDDINSPSVTISPGRW
jgi:hypothetical protein